MRHMSLEQFQQLLDLHGSDLTCWPSVEGIAAMTLVRLDQQARAMLDGMHRLDRAWAITRPAPTSPELPLRILQSLPTNQAPTRSLRPLWADLFGELGGWRVAGPAFAVALTLGITLGYTLNSSGSFDLIDLAGLADTDIEY